MARARGKSDDHVRPLTDGWEVVGMEPGRADDPEAVEALDLPWRPADVPGTVASAMRAGGALRLETAAAKAMDATDWWYRCRFECPGARPPQTVLRFGGLATVAEAWLNGALILRSDNMFLEHEVDVTNGLREENRLVLRFRSLGELLRARRPRPRWKTRLVDEQQLRWFRTTLLGRIPGWSPPVVAVGPFRPIVLEERTVLTVQEADVRARVEDRDGIVDTRMVVRLLGAGRVEQASLSVGDDSTMLRCGAREDGAVELAGSLRVPGAPLWWPHTHGARPLHEARVIIGTAGALPSRGLAASAPPASGPSISVSLGRVGFRVVELDAADDGFALRVNGAKVFCRGACWTPDDLVALGGTRASIAASLAAAHDAGMNMIRLSGTMVYEDDAFYELCDELGILVWQDFMFANLDYPFADDRFLASAQLEAAQFLGRTQASPCLAVLCGNSEIEQQVAMLGLPRELSGGAFFREALPATVHAVRPDVPYWPSSPSGGELPFQIDAGVSHYYGVGAYLRPLDDARRAGVRFTSECLAFANVPEDRTIELAVGPGESPLHHPAWKRRVPRDSGSGWDFDDVRDHYLGLLFGVDPMRLRYADMERYLALSRVTTGEAMASAFSEWRRCGSTCAGGIVLFYRDLWPGAGWGVVDSEGVPKAAYYYLKRVFSPVALLAIDEGLNGLALHAVNDTDSKIEANLRLSLFRRGETEVGEGTRAIEVPARGCVEVRAEALLGRFADTTYAYRFGPPGHNVAVASMVDAGTGALLGQAFHFPLGLGSMSEADLGLTAELEEGPDGGVSLTVRTRAFAQSVAVDVAGFVPEDSYFHLAPRTARRVALSPRTGRADKPRLGGTVRALNAPGATNIVVQAAVQRDRGA